MNAYGEIGDGLAALHYSAQSYQSLVSRVGSSASKQMKTRFGAVGGSQTPGQDYLVAGLGVSLAFTERFSLMLSCQGQFFRHDLQARLGNIRFRYEF